jgi:hypothetical protein
MGHHVLAAMGVMVRATNGPAQWCDDPRPAVKVADDDDHDILLVILYMI